MAAVVYLSEPLATQIRGHAREMYPEECCGILFGTDADTARTIVEARRADNAFESGERHHRFTIGPKALLEAERDATSRKVTVVGFYHSHPDQPARPSAYDREQAWGFYSYFIVSVRHGEPGELTSWRKDEVRDEFVEEEIEFGQREAKGLESSSD